MINDYDFIRKQSDPPQLQSRHDFFSSLKLGIQCPNFSAGNASEEPHSAASFSAKGLGNSPENATYNSAYYGSEILTPTLAGRTDSGHHHGQDFNAELDRELLCNQENVVS